MVRLSKKKEKKMKRWLLCLVVGVVMVGALSAFAKTKQECDDEKAQCISNAPSGKLIPIYSEDGTMIIAYKSDTTARDNWMINCGVQYAICISQVHE